MSSPAVLILIGVLIMWIFASWKEYKEGKHLVIIFIILVGAVISAVGAFWSSMQEKNYQDEIADLNHKIMYTVTGGDSYGYLFFTGPNEANECEMMLKTDGEYPIYDVSLKIRDVEEETEFLLDEMEKGNLPYDSKTKATQHLSKYSRIEKIGNFGPNQVLNLGLIKFSQEDKQSYIININARNGAVTQFIKFRRVNGKWRREDRVFFNGDLMRKTIDPEFPLEKEDNQKGVRS